MLITLFNNKKCMKNFFQKNLLIILAVVSIGFLSSYIYADSAAGVLRVTRGGTGVENITEGQFLVGKSIDEMQATSSISMDSAGNVTITKSLNAAAITIDAVTDGDMLVSGKVGIGTTSLLYDLNVSGEQRIVSNDTSGHLLFINVTNEAYNGEIVRIESAATSSTQGLIYMTSPSPEVEYVESDQSNGDGKWETRVQNMDYQLNSRNAENDSFESAYIFQARDNASGDKTKLTLYLDHTSANTNVLVFRNENASVSARPGISWYDGSEGDYEYARMSAKIGSGRAESTWYLQVADASKSLQERLAVDQNGWLGVGTTSPVTSLDVDGGIRAVRVTADPCGTGYPEGVLFYNGTSDYYCFCDGSGIDKKVSDNGACF